MAQTATNEQVVTPKQIIEGLCEIQDRGPGTPGEEEASRKVKGWMENMGLEPVIEEFQIPANARFGLVIYSVLAITATFLAWSHPLATTILAGALVYSFRVEHSTDKDLLLRLFPKSTSRNVIGKYTVEGAKKTVVLSGHMDASRAGMMFHPKITGTFGNKERRHGPLFSNLIAHWTVFILALLKLLGYGNGYLAYIVAAGVVIYFLLTAILTLQWAFSSYTPGANDNASGVASAFRIYEILRKADLKNVNLVLLITGSEENGLRGMKDFVSKHGKEYDRKSTYFINMESVGGGTLRFTVGEGIMKRFMYPTELPSLARRLSRREEFGDIRGQFIPAGTDAKVPAMEGYPSISILAANSIISIPNYHWKTDTPENIDYDVVEKGSRLGAAMAEEIDKGMA